MTTLTELCAALDGLRIPWANTEWAKGEEPEPPYIILIPEPSGGRSYGAADGTWVDTVTYDVELYTHARSYATERKVQAALDAIRLFWRKDIYNIESEYLAETVYTVTVRED
jgi:hypothetical protein